MMNGLLIDFIEDIRNQIHAHPEFKTDLGKRESLADELMMIEETYVNGCSIAINQKMIFLAMRIDDGDIEGIDKDFDSLIEDIRNTKI